LVVEANDASQAEQIANVRGLFVAAVRPTEPPALVRPVDLGIAGAIGNLDAVCPHCNQGLEKKPGRKKKCPRCGQFIYVRTRPSDGEKVLVTEAQAEKIQEQWFIVHGGKHDAYLEAKRQVAQGKVKLAERFAEEKAMLAERFGREPSDNDVQWGLLNDELLGHIQQRNWGLFRNVKLAMAELLRKEGRSTQALGFYLEVCYLDLNGPNNIGGETDSELLREFPPWDPSSALSLRFTALPGLAADMIEKMNLTPATVEGIFRQKAFALHAGLHLPLSPTDAWPQVKQALFDKGG
jgi:DNA-directed RNA polymerase subunit RPC12/RpoP